MFKVGDRVTYGTAPGVGRIVLKDTGKEIADVWWDDYGFMTRCHYYQLRKVRETTSMDNPFIETVTTKSLARVQNINPKALGWVDISISPFPGNKTLDLVVGAAFEDRSSCCLDKESLGTLLKMLQEVHDLMEG